ncbi:MAG: hypothetical protein PHT00_01605 [Candidatus Methanomethylophilus sp.]|nr:hypothetical protein [Methanomethylophilus sp.]MDD3232851.1 hypothetical protein [Methanomethylophilus sp.]MDD4221608.1 hypothetical protein [Methanomethylophilus sp.]MDD4668981.1 hypothetical protein [Methanomethylophilus sp.]
MEHIGVTQIELYADRGIVAAAVLSHDVDDCRFGSNAEILLNMT